MMVAMVAVALSGCSNNPVGPPSAVTNQFPLTVGSTWTYAVFDSIAQQADTVTVTALKQTSVSASGATYLWTYRYSNRIDSVTVVSNADTVNYLIPNAALPRMTFVFPLVAGQSLQGLYYRGSVGAGSASVPAGTFPNSFEVFEQPYEGNFYGGTTCWIAPHIGIVKEQIQWLITVSNQRENTTWQLISYSIAR